jgi:hypothetical protein
MEIESLNSLMLPGYWPVVTAPMMIILLLAIPFACLPIERRKDKEGKT